MSDTTLGQVSDAVVARIQKLLALAGNNSNEHEAAAASEKAMQMAAEHGLELAQLEAKAEGTSTLGGKREKKTHDRAAMYRYQRETMAAVAQVHFCKHFVTEVTAMSNSKMRTVKRHVLLGREVNVMLALMTYDYLIETMDRLLPYTGMEKRGKSALLWLEGCSYRLGTRLAAKREQMEADSRRQAAENEARARHPSAAPLAGNALVISDVYSSEEDFNNDYIKGWEPGTTARKRKEEDARNAAWAAQYEAERPAREAAMKARAAELRAKWESQGFSGQMLLDILRYAAYGFYGDEECVAKAKAAERDRNTVTKPLTEKQRQAAQERARREESATYQRWERSTRRTRTAEYQAGSQKGAEIGLDTQVGATHKARIG